MKVRINDDEYYPFFYMNDINTDEESYSENEDIYELPDELVIKYKEVLKNLHECQKQIDEIVYAEYYHKVIEITDEYHIKIEKKDIDDIITIHYGDMFNIGVNYGKVVLIGDNFYELESINESNEKYKTIGQIIVADPYQKGVGKFIDIKIGDIAKR